MPTQRLAAWWMGLGAGALLCSTAWAQQQPEGPSIPTVYCATVNTADMTPISSDYQSDGRCFNNCTELGYALAIVQHKNCWCSNLIPNPDDRKPLKDCQAPCPGYPFDHCGGNGVYGYLEVLGFMPSGTAEPGGSSPQPTTTSSKVPKTSSTSSASSSSSSSSSSSDHPPSTTPSSSSSSDTPSVTTVTIGGTVTTITATPATTHDAAASSSSGDHSHGLASGAIAGIVIGVIGAIAVGACFAWLWWSRKHRRDEADSNPLDSPIRSRGSGSGAHSPPMADMSDGRYAPSAGSGQLGWDSDRCRSHLMPVDPRLDPFIYSSDQNTSRLSFTSLQDNQDYSRRVHQPQRVLRAVNPDPEED
ncbi:hypothetical protein VTJ83DRAFT_4283 [Remersonia thermophila]|uniref:WSC domain-containing protein n=1 Tax=Remersonia thermophila TaxID=72144 RepID=A0ABR4DB09_9PEZI